MQTAKFTRKSFQVDAVQVTAENMEEIAKWCQGKVFEEGNRSYIKVNVANFINERQTKAFAGDWVLYASKGYKVYTDKAFTTSFEPVEELRTVAS